MLGRNRKFVKPGRNMVYELKTVGCIGKRLIRHINRIFGSSKRSVCFEPSRLKMLKLTVFLIFAIAVTSAQEEEEVCLGAEDGEKIGVGADISCTEYWYCEGEYGYKEDCASLEDGEEYEFDYNTNDCGYADEVNCASGLEPEYPEPDPDPEYPEYPDPETQPPVTQTPGTTQQTTLDPTVPDIECPTDQPGKIIFFPSSNCSEYFICANGFRMKMTCMEGFTWNQQEQQCDYPIFSRCSVSFSRII